MDEETPQPQSLAGAPSIWARARTLARGLLSVRRGQWGEEQAARFLRRAGMEIVARNVRPVAGDRRCEIDIIAHESACNAIVFVEVKTHLRHSERASRLWSIDRRKKSNLLRACASWLLRRNWRGNYRFDVVEVYGDGEKGAAPEIDHIRNVPLFPPNWRFRR